MIEYNNVIDRNIEEQVQKNKEDIARHWEVDRVLADFGITVLGRVNTYEDIADLDEGENWGYGYLVGEEAPYVVYVWTRPNPNIGEPEAYWLNIGAISIVGPTGPAGRSISDATLNTNSQLVLTFTDGTVMTLPESLKGKEGPAGKNGTSSRTVATRETNGVRITTYDQNNAQISTAFLNDGRKGETGAIGPRGESATLNIIGTFDSVSQAPNPQTRELGDAFILANGPTTTLYILTGDKDIVSTYSWQETSFGGGTRITLNGQTLSTWRADSVVQKMVPSDITPAAYVSIDPFDDGLIGISQQIDADTIARRDSGGRLSTATPTGASHAANKQYVDSMRQNFQTQLDDMQNQIDNLPVGGGSTSSSGWTTASVGYGSTLWLPLDKHERYEMMFISKHGVGDNTFTSPVFLLPSGEDQISAVTNLTIPVMVGGSDNHWEVNYDPPGEQYSVFFMYNNEMSSIHDITAYYKKV